MFFLDFSLYRTTQELSRIAHRIEQETKGSLRFTLAALYPMLYRLEKQKWIRGTWETSPVGRRRCYRLTPAGKQRLSPLRKEWSELFAALHRLAGVSNADWQQIVRQRLEGVALEQDDSAQEVVEELAGHLEEQYQSLLREGYFKSKCNPLRLATGH